MGRAACNRRAVPETTTAVILAAGLGSRLRPLTDDRPKALIDIGGETLLGRAARLLIEHGVEHLVVATGYREQAIRVALESFGVRVSYCPNPEYATTQNAVSLAACADAVAGGAFFKLDGDLVFSSEVLARLDSAAVDLAVAVDSVAALDAEAMKVAADESGAIRAFGKQLALADSAGESIGIERIAGAASEDVFRALATAREQGRTTLYYEDVYSEMIAAGSLRAGLVEVGDLPWTEVDDAADLERARALVGADTLQRS